MFGEKQTRISPNISYEAVKHNSGGLMIWARFADTESEYLESTVNPSVYESYNYFKLLLLNYVVYLGMWLPNFRTS